MNALPPVPPSPPPSPQVAPSASAGSNSPLSAASGASGSTFAGAMQDAGAKPARKTASSKTANDGAPGGALPVTGNVAPPAVPAAPAVEATAAGAGAAAAAAATALATAQTAVAGAQPAADEADSSASAAGVAGTKTGVNPAGLSDLAADSQSPDALDSPGSGAQAGSSAPAFGLPGGSSATDGAGAVGASAAAADTLAATSALKVGSKAAVRGPSPAALPSSSGSKTAVAAGGRTGSDSAPDDDAGADAPTAAPSAGAQAIGAAGAAGVLASADASAATTASGYTASQANAAAASAGDAGDTGQSPAGGAAAGGIAGVAGAAGAAGAAGSPLAAALAVARTAASALNAANASAMEAAGNNDRRSHGADASSDGSVDAAGGLSQLGSTPVSGTDATPTPTFRIAANVDSTDFTQGLADRVSWMASNDLNGAKLQVNPAQLGPIELRITVTGDHAQVWMSTHSAVTRDALESSAPKLREMLGAQGFGQVSVDISQRSFQDRSAYAQPYEAPASKSSAAATSSVSMSSAPRVSLGAVDAYA